MPNPPHTRRMTTPLTANNPRPPSVLPTSNTVFLLLPDDQVTLNQPDASIPRDNRVFTVVNLTKERYNMDDPEATIEYNGEPVWDFESDKLPNRLIRYWLTHSSDSCCVYERFRDKDQG